MCLGVLDKTIVIGYLLHCDVVHFFFQSFLFTVHHYFGHHTMKTPRNYQPRYLLWEVLQREGEHDPHLRQKQQ